MPPRLRETELKAPRAPSVRRLRLTTPRDESSIELDGQTITLPGSGGKTAVVPDFVPWVEFLEALTLEQGQHITIVGTTGSGKTTLALRLLPYRKYSCVLATKRKDSSLFPKLLREGYVFSEDPELDADNEPKVIFRPELSEPTKEAMAEQAEQFRRLLLDVFDSGGWQVYGDEIRYLSENLKLKEVLELLWLQGRSLDITMVITTQRPVSIPVVAFESARHLFLFRTTDQANIDRAAEFEGANKPLLRWLLPRLSEHEVLYIEQRTGRMMRTKVRL